MHGISVSLVFTVVGIPMARRCFVIGSIVNKILASKIARSFRKISCRISGIMSWCRSNSMRWPLAFGNVVSSGCSHFTKNGKSWPLNKNWWGFERKKEMLLSKVNPESVCSRLSEMIVRVPILVFGFASIYLVAAQKEGKVHIVEFTKKFFPHSGLLRGCPRFIYRSKIYREFRSLLACAVREVELPGKFWIANTKGSKRIYYIIINALASMNDVSKF